MLTPREAADLLGVRAPTVAAWARLGLLKPAVRTPGGHRRYFRGDILALRDVGRSPRPNSAYEEMMRDAVRLYEQGWPVRRVRSNSG